MPLAYLPSPVASIHLKEVNVDASSKILSKKGARHQKFSRSQFPALGKDNKMFGNTNESCVINVVNFVYMAPQFTAGEHHSSI